MRSISFVLRPERSLPLIAAGALTAAAILTATLGPADAQDSGGAEVTGGTLTWGISTYLNSANFGRPNPLPEAYFAPATFDEEARLTTWGDASGTLSDDGSASLSFAGASVNYTSTGGGWLMIADLEVELDAAGNGTITAEVSYGTSPGEFDPEAEPTAGPERVTIVTLEGNDAPAMAADGEASWDGLSAIWSSAFTDFLAAGPWAYASTVNNDEEDRAPAPISINIASSVALPRPPPVGRSRAARCCAARGGARSGAAAGDECADASSLGVERFDLLQCRSLLGVSCDLRGSQSAVALDLRFHLRQPMRGLRALGQRRHAPCVVEPFAERVVIQRKPGEIVR